jgi:exopolyphosphatase / guanosine-5'-triphosphate,3'-diphosphate pyrophosphatase
MSDTPKLGVEARSVGGLRIAAIDIGTNSIHMVIARATGAAGFELVDREREVVQIGRDSFESGSLRASAIRRTVEALARFVDLARRRHVDRILCTATAAVREARNGGAFLQAARDAAGIAPRVIPPEEEGRLIYLAVKSALKLEPRPSLIVDIGGGSMQLVVANQERLIEALSAPLGALRLTESRLPSDPPTRRELQRLATHIRKKSADILETVAAHEPGRVYGSSGSIHALAQLAHHTEQGSAIAHLNGHVLSRASLDGLLHRLQRMSLVERERLPGLDTLRAEIIVAGGMVLQHVLESVDADGITLSDFGVREGLVTDYLISHGHEISTIGQVEDLRLRSVLQLLQKFQPEDRHLRHAQHVARLSLSLFDGLRRVHGLGDEAREMLHFGALLHDVGAVVGYDRHAEHSSYIIRNGNLRGLSAGEVEMIALIARYHGKARPRKRDDAFGALDKRERRALRWLSAMLRIAEGLDRSHYQLVQGLQLVRRREGVTIRLTVRRGARLEVWAARRRVDLLEKLIGRRVRVSVARAAGQRRGPTRPETSARTGVDRAKGGRAR